MNFWYTNTNNYCGRTEQARDIIFQIVKVEMFVCMHSTNESFKVFRFCKMFVVVKCSKSTLSCFSR